MVKPIGRCGLSTSEIFQCLMDAGRPVAGFPIHEQWLDVGEKEDYLKAQELAAGAGSRT